MRRRRRKSMSWIGPRGSRSLIVCAAAAAAAAAALAACGSRAGAQTVNWNNSTGGTFNAASNWNPAAVPGAGSFAVFGLANTYTVTFSSSPTNAAAYFPAGSVTFFASSATPQTYTVSGAVHVNGGSLATSAFSSNLDLSAGSLLVYAGGRLTAGDVTAGSLAVGTNGNGTMIASTLNVTSASVITRVGSAGATGSLGFGSGTIAGPIEVGAGPTSNSKGSLRTSGTATIGGTVLV